MSVGNGPKQRPLRKDQEKAADGRRSSLLARIVTTALAVPLPCAMLGILWGVTARITYETFKWGWSLFGWL